MTTLEWRRNECEAYQITGVSIVCSTVASGADQRKHQSSASLAFVRGIHLWPVNSLHKRPVTQKMFPFDDTIMKWGRSGSNEPTIMWAGLKLTETKMSSFWQHFHHWLHWKLSFWQLPVQPVMKISSKWQRPRFSAVGKIQKLEMK